MTAEQGNVRREILEHLYKECTQEIACEKCFYLYLDRQFAETIDEWSNMPRIYRPYVQHPSAQIIVDAQEVTNAAETMIRNVTGRRVVSPVTRVLVQPVQPVQPEVKSHILARKKKNICCRMHDILPAILNDHPILYNVVPECAMQQLLILTDLYRYVSTTPSWIPAYKKKKRYTELQLRSIFYQPPPVYIPPPRPTPEQQQQRVPLPAWMTYRL
jgi:hypothetical protein